MFAPRSLLIPGMLVLTALTAGARAETTLTYADLVRRMTDLERLAVLPLPGERAAQCSSYDRASKYDEKTGKYIRWDANGDGTGIIRKEGKRIVMAEMEGPGCLWRIWSAKADKGHVKIYLDGQASRRSTSPSATISPARWPLSTIRCSPTISSRCTAAGRTCTCRFPIRSRARSWPTRAGAHYHFDLQLLPEGDCRADLQRAALAAENATALQKTNDFFHDRLGEDPAGPRQGQETTSECDARSRDKPLAVAELSGPRAITGIKVKRMNFSDRADQMAALRKLALRITWDGQAKPAVWCPAGRFLRHRAGREPLQDAYWRA